VRARDLPERTDQGHEHQAEGERNRKAVRRGAGGGLAQRSRTGRRRTGEDQEEGADHLGQPGPEHVRRVNPMSVQSGGRLDARTGRHEVLYVGVEGGPWWPGPRSALALTAAVP